jgi:isoleucyl-tRNA synthetase
MDLVFERLTIWLAPLIPFTMEEAWTTRFPEAGSNCLRIFPDTPAAWSHPAEAARWEKVQAVTRVVMGALEAERREKRLGGPLEAAPVVYIDNPELLAAFDVVTLGSLESSPRLVENLLLGEMKLDPAEVFRTSQATLAAGAGPQGAFALAEVPGVSVEPRKAEGRKCARSWRILPEVGLDPRYPDLSQRDAEAVAAWDAARV